MGTETATTIRAVDEIVVGMGQVTVGQSPQRLVSILGSCVGISLYHPRARRGALAHVILPDSQGRPQSLPGKFADTAIPEMLKLLAPAGMLPGSLVAKIAGGANMFSLSGPLQIGIANGLAAAESLAALGIRVIAQDIGGCLGRRVSFDCSTGDMSIEIGSECRVI